ncbi:PhnE/PtxC family ABC transporter permease [Fischerella sp. PCC 9605]|uniref:PhnE/PtxC family ABC transporter permease n=1 Tax=Fischerella sp. PCC 9605 TaxID=1173024 RepID=UPI0004B11B0A|nr:ABC transporter permease subunit [Fischerella sp. PCC 9605]
MGKWSNRKADRQASPHPPLSHSPYLLWGLVFLVAVVWSLQVAGIFQEDLINQGGWSLVFPFLAAVVSPELSLEFLLLTLDATLKTLAYAVCGTFFCVVIGLVGGVLSSEVWWKSQGRNYNAFWLLVRAILAIPRAIHELIWGLFFVNIFGLDPLVAVLAIAIPFGAITAKVFSEILDETPHEPLLALLNSGVPPLSAFAYSLIPQAFPNLLSYSFYRFECSIRSAAVLGIIGAGGLGYQIYLSLQSLRYQQVWTLIFALLLLSGSTDFLSALLRQRLELPSRLDLNLLKLKRRSPHHPYPTGSPPGTLREAALRASTPVPLPLREAAACLRDGDRLLGGWSHRLRVYTPSPNLFLLGAFILLVFSFWYVKADFAKLWEPRTAERLARIIQDVFPPQWIDLNQLLILSTQTLAMSILAITGAGLGGILLSFLAAREEGRRGRGEEREKDTPLSASREGLGVRFFVFLFTRFLLLFARAVPEPIWALIFLFVLFPGILPGAIALAIHNLGILGRLMAEVIENLDQRPLRSLMALGASNSQVFIYGVLPATVPRFVAYILYRWEVCIRATVIVGLVGAGGLGRLLTEQLSSFDYQGLLTTLIVFIGLTFVVDALSTTVRRFLR